MADMQKEGGERRGKIISFKGRQSQEVGFNPDKASLNSRETTYQTALENFVAEIEKYTEYSAEVRQLFETFLAAYQKYRQVRTKSTIYIGLKTWITADIPDHFSEDEFKEILAKAQSSFPDIFLGINFSELKSTSLNLYKAYLEEITPPRN